MGNCQTAEAATVVIQHPGGNKVDRIYWSVSANVVMNSYGGHYVAQVVASPAEKTEDGTPVKQLKLLQPDDTLHIGQVYRLISFQDVLKEFAEKRCVKLGKLLKERRGFNPEQKNNQPGLESSSNQQSASEKEEVPHLGSGGGGVGSGSSSRGVGRRHHGQWKPALQSISELGT